MAMKLSIGTCLLFSVLLVLLSAARIMAQTDEEHDAFCKALNKVFDSGKHENFESLKNNSTPESPFLKVPGYSIKLDRFPVTYVDKDHRFVARTELNFDSLTAINQLEDYKAFVTYCLDSAKWNWQEVQGDDKSTIFFKELKEWSGTSDMFTLKFAVTHVANKVYSINMYLRRR